MTKTYLKNEVLINIQEDEYQLAPGIRSSELKPALRSSSHWRASKLEPRKDTPAFALGRLIHLCILEPARFAAQVVKRPSVGDLRGTKAKMELDAFRQTLRPGQQDVSEDDWRTLEGVMASVRAHSRLPNLLRSGRPECSLFWKDEAHGLDCKMRADFLSERGFIVDIKTTKDASSFAFARDAVNLHYNVSAAHYLEGVRVAQVGDPDNFIIVAIEKTPPYAIALYTLDGDMLDRGHQLRHQAMATIGHALRTQEYSGYSEDFQVLECPKWAPRPIEFADK